MKEFLVMLGLLFYTLQLCDFILCLSSIEFCHRFFFFPLSRSFLGVDSLLLSLKLSYCPHLRIMDPETLRRLCPHLHFELMWFIDDNGK